MTTPCTISLEKKTSQAACTLGTSFGCNQDYSMWTDNGCRGTFTCDGVKNVDGDQDGSGRHTFQCNAAPTPQNVKVNACGENALLIHTDSLTNPHLLTNLFIYIHYTSYRPQCTPWITPLQRKILFNMDAIAVNQDVTPQGHPLVEGDLSLWTRALSDGSVAVAFYNENDTPISLALDFGALAKKHGAGWSATTKANVRDLWKFTNTSVTGRFPASGNMTVKEHQTILLRMWPTIADTAFAVREETYGSWPILL